MWKTQLAYFTGALIHAKNYNDRDHQSQNTYEMSVVGYWGGGARWRGGEESNVIDGTIRNYIVVYLKTTNLELKVLWSRLDKLINKIWIWKRNNAISELF